MNIEQLIYERSLARLAKNWGKSDEIRNTLDNNLVFVFDTKVGQDVYYLTDGYFKRQDKMIETIGLSKRQYVEYRIKQEIKANANFDAWLFSINQRIT